MSRLERRIKVLLGSVVGKRHKLQEFCAINVDALREVQHNFLTIVLSNTSQNASELMRLRLVHKLSILLVSSVLIAVAALGGFAALNLRNGFRDYLAIRENERLEKFAAIVEQSVQAAGGPDALTGRRVSMRAAMDEFLESEGLRRPREGLRVEPDQSAGDGAKPNDQPSLRRGPPRGVPDAFQWRVWVVGLDGETLLGRALPGSVAQNIDRPIRSDGRVIGWARMRPAEPALGGVQSHFLRAQYVGILGVSATLIALALVSAGWFARRWSSPLMEVKDATARIARGQFDVRLDNEELGRRGDEIGDVVRNVNQMAESLQRLDGSRRRLVADISHELRTPLTVLRGHAEALIDGVRPLETKSIYILCDEITRLELLVEDLHLLALSDLQALPYNFEVGDLMDLIGGVVQRFYHRCSAVDVALRLETASPEPISVRWDHARIAQVLGNLIENSLRYTDPPGQIVIRAQPDSHRVVIVIEDSAPGVSKTDLPRLFEPLFRADPARSRHSAGSGLGLSICAAIVQAHGGDIAAAQSVLGGVAIKITLPLFAGESIA